MDTMKILLGATVALLLGALAMSWKGLQQGYQTVTAEEFSRYKQKVDLLELEIQQSKEAQKQATEIQMRNFTPQPSASEQDLLAAKAQLAEKEAQLRELEDEKERAQRNAELYKDEAGIAYTQNNEQNDLELRRARQIAQALVMGKVKEYVPNEEVGDIVVVDVVMPENVQPGAILAIRRNTGILGQIKITDVTPEGAVGSPMPGFAKFTPEVGDELIVPPQL